jgi:hypothetical protein
MGSNERWWMALMQGGGNYRRIDGPHVARQVSARACLFHCCLFGDHRCY